MDTKQLILTKIINSLVVIFVTVGVLLWLQYNIKNYFDTTSKTNLAKISELEQQVSELKRFNDTAMVQLQHTIMSAEELKKETNKLLTDEVRAYIKNNSEQVSRLIDAKFNFKDQKGEGEGEIKETRSEAGDVTSRMYTFSDKYLDFNVDTLTSGAAYTIKLSNIPLRALIVQTELPDGRFKINDYIVLTRMDTGEELSIESAEVRTTLNKDKTFIYSLTSLIGIDYDKTINANVGVSLFSYGRTLHPKDTEYRFLNIGISGNRENIGIYFIPITWNLGRLLPFIQEAQIGPGYKFEITNNDNLFTMGLLHNF